MDTCESISPSVPPNDYNEKSKTGDAVQEPQILHKEEVEVDGWVFNIGNHCFETFLLTLMTSEELHLNQNTIFS